MDNSPDYYPEDDEDDEQRCNNMDKYPQTAKTAMRCGISVYVVSLLLNSMLVDQGVTDKSKFVNAKKIAREQYKVGTELEVRHNNIKGYYVAGVDGKKSDISLEKNQHEKVDNQVIVCQSRRRYIDHIRLLISTGAAIATGLYNVSYRLPQIKMF